MTKKFIFKFADYKAFLLEEEAERGKIQRGFRSRMAEALSCQPAFISQVLNKGAHFSPEQAFRIARLLILETDEIEYFLCLVEYGRAGTHELKEYVKEKLDQLQEKNLEIQKRVGPSGRLTPEVQATFFSHWQYAAIQVLTTIPEYRTLDSIAAALKLSRETVARVIVFLTSVGLLQERKGEFVPGTALIHLQRDSPHSGTYHSNWRLAAIQAIKEPRVTDVHYSTVSSVSREDFKKIRAHLVDQIQLYVETVQPSNEETLCAFNLDFFELINR